VTIKKSYHKSLKKVCEKKNTGDIIDFIFFLCGAIPCLINLDIPQKECLLKEIKPVQCTAVYDEEKTKIPFSFISILYFLFAMAYI
jgi:hypothetical protein